MHTGFNFLSHVYVYFQDCNFNLMVQSDIIENWVKNHSRNIWNFRSFIMWRRKSSVGKFICYSEFCNSWFLISTHIFLFTIWKRGNFKNISVVPYPNLMPRIVPTTPYSYYLLALYFKIGWIPSVCFFSIFFLSSFLRNNKTNQRKPE